MERNKSIMVRLNEVELAKVDVLCLKGSRDGWFRNLIAPMAESRAAIEELAIQSYRLAARAAHDDGEHDKAAEYNRLIAKSDKDLAILRRSGE